MNLYLSKTAARDLNALVVRWGLGRSQAIALALRHEAMGVSFPVEEGGS